MTIYTTPEAFIDPTPSAGRRFGGAVGRGVSSGLELLMEAKLRQMGEQEKLAQQREKFAQLQSILGGGDRVQGEPTRGGLPGQIPEEISDEQILTLSEDYPNVAKILQSQKEGRAKVTEAKAKREFERAKPILARADERAEQITQKESSLALMKDAVQTGNLGFFSPDNLAEITGIEGLRTPKGAQFISSGKEYFLGSLKRAGARPNQWIEQQIQKMLPKMGRSEAANLTVLAALESELAIEKQQLDIIDRLAQEDEAQFGYIKGNIGQRTRKELKKFADEEQKRLEISLREIQKTEKVIPRREKIETTEVIMIDRQGRQRVVEKKDVKAARAAGYKLSS